MNTQFTAILTMLAVIASFTPSRAVDNIIPLTSITNEDYVLPPDFPSGTPTLGGVTFDLPANRLSWGSNPNSQPPDLSVTLSFSIPFASSVRLLLNTGNTYTSQMSIGDHIGSIVLSFASGPTQTTALLVGNNIREVAVGSTVQPVINTFTDPNLQEVYRGHFTDNIDRVADMLTIPLSGDRTLTSIHFIDESQLNIGQTNPVLTLKAVTVQSVPEPLTTIFVALGSAGLMLRRFRNGRIAQSV
jgi:hypothetical protein